MKNHYTLSGCARKLVFAFVISTISFTGAYAQLTQQKVWYMDNQQVDFTDIVLGPQVSGPLPGTPLVPFNKITNGVHDLNGNHGAPACIPVPIAIGRKGQ